MALQMTVLNPVWSKDKEPNDCGEAEATSEGFGSLAVIEHRTPGQVLPSSQTN